MPFRRRTTRFSRRRGVRRVSRFRAPARRTFRRRRLNANTSYTFTRMQATSITTGAGVWYWKLSDLQGFTEFQNLFDQYRIKSVSAKILPRGNVLNVDSTYSIPQFLWVYDPDVNSTTPAPVQSDMLQKQGMKVQRMDRFFSKTFYPKSMGIVQTPLTQQPAELKWGRWLDLQQPDVEHGGVQWYIQGLNNFPIPYVTTVMFKFVIQCKGVQ